MLGAWRYCHYSVLETTKTKEKENGDEIENELGYVVLRH